MICTTAFVAWLAWPTTYFSKIHTRGTCFSFGTKVAISSNQCGWIATALPSSPTAGRQHKDYLKPEIGSLWSGYFLSAYFLFKWWHSCETLCTDGSRFAQLRSMSFIRLLTWFHSPFWVARKILLRILVMAHQPYWSIRLITGSQMMICLR